EDGKASARKWGFDIEQPPKPDRFIEDGDKIEVGNFSLEVLHTPGHSPGGVSYLHERVVFAGDCLFQGSIGRTDFRMGSLEELAKSIRTRLYTLPDNTLVYTGHGPVTTIGDEKAHNPFVRP
ncbi:MAG: MBL fold metallo-hydrolase, partial [Thermoplasmata archaeon]|nr:MBL fold metallo-hydrolase [Thermoplasmata archaeon]